MSKREDTRPKADLNWHLSGDALRPKEAPFGFIGQNPVELALIPNQSRLIDLGIASNVPLLVFPTRTHMDDLSPTGNRQWPIIVSPGENIQVVVRNTSQHSALAIDDREALVCIHPLVFSGTTEVA